MYYKKNIHLLASSPVELAVDVPNLPWQISVFLCCPFSPDIAKERSVLTSEWSSIVVDVVVE